MVQVDLSRFQDLAPREGEQLASQPCSTPRLITDLAKKLVRPAVLRHFRQTDFGPTHDDPDDVIEVVRDASRQLADCLKLLQCGNLLPEQASLRHILDDDLESLEPASFIVNGAPAQAHEDRLSVFA